MLSSTSIKLYVFVLIILVSLFNLNVYAYGFDLDCRGVVKRVVDGDTIYVYVDKVFDQKFKDFLNQEIKVRFADINAPELDTYEGVQAKIFLDHVLKNYSYIVYLDIDDIYIYGKYGRVIAVVYVEYNDTHLLNINLFLVSKGYAEIRDYENQFNPLYWRLYVEKPFNSFSKNTLNSVNNKVQTEKKIIDNHEIYNKLFVVVIITISSIILWFILKKLVK
ncbi:MAG: hypothetical protein B6U76_05890 [Desulfurococcales archaeon ex4484_217_2]|nr:MAG: hypothetical protein B6U76_05890 [Desulfurococcales archaeon ex4484_217_2]